MKKKKNSKRGNNGKGNGWTDATVMVNQSSNNVGFKVMMVRQNEETVIVTCTKKVYPFNLHYNDYPDLKSYGPYVLCNRSEGKCILCEVGKAMVKKFITPVFSIEAGGIKFLPISPSFEPFALLPQLVNIFNNGGSRHLLSIRRDDRVKYSVTRLEFEDGMKHQIVPIIKEFRAMLKKGEVNTESVYPRIDNMTLADVPEIERIMAAKGITLRKNDLEEDEED